MKKVKPTITLESVVTRLDTDLIASDLGQEIIMMNLQSGDYFGLNQVGAEIWKQIEHPIKIDDICSKLLETYDVSSDDCKAKTIEFLNKLYSDELLKVL